MADKDLYGTTVVPVAWQEDKVVSANAGSRGVLVIHQTIIKA